MNIGITQEFNGHLGPCVSLCSADAAACPGVIGGIVSFCLLHAVEWVLDWGSARTNGAFGTATPAIPADAHHGMNPKDSAHETPNANGKAAVDEEVSPWATNYDSSSLLTHAWICTCPG